MREPEEQIYSNFEFPSGLPPLSLPSTSRSPELPEFAPALLPEPPPLITSPQWQIKFITTERQLKALSKKLSKLSAFPMDYETFGLSGEPLNQRLSWAMFGIPDPKSSEKGIAYLVDVLALEKEATSKHRASPIASSHASPNPLEPLREVLTNPRVKKVIQHSQFESDQTIDYGIKLEGIIDIEKISRELRPALPSRKLGSLAAEFLGVTLDKEEQTSDWSKRPPDAKQLAYMPRDLQVPWEIYLRQKHLKAETIPERFNHAGDVLNALVEIQKERLSLLRAAHQDYITIGNALGVLTVRSLRCKKLLKEIALLEYQHSSGERRVLESDHGRVRLQCPRKLIMKRLSQIFTHEEKKKILYEHLSKSALENALREAKKKDRSVIISQVVGAVFEKQGFAKKPTLLVSPNYDRLYFSPAATAQEEVPASAPDEVAATISRQLPLLTSISFFRTQGDSRDLYLTLTSRTEALEKSVTLKVNLDSIGDGSLAPFFQRVVDDSSIALICHGKRELSSILSELGVSLPKDHSLIDTYELAREFRSDLPTYRLEACVMEILGTKEAVLSPIQNASMLPKLAAILERMDKDSALPFSIEQLCAEHLSGEDGERELRVAKVVDSLLARLTRNEAVRLALTRANNIGERYDVLGVKFQRTKAQLRPILEGLRKVALKQNRDSVRSEITLVRSGEKDTHALEAVLARRKELIGKRFLICEKDGDNLSIGAASLTPRRLSVLRLEYLKTHFPEIAAQLIQVKINLRELDKIFKEQGLSKQGKAETLKTIFKRDKKSVKPPTVKIRPRYGLIYERGESSAHKLN